MLKAEMGTVHIFRPWNWYFVLGKKDIWTDSGNIELLQNRKRRTEAIGKSFVRKAQTYGLLHLVLGRPQMEDDVQL